MLQVIPTLQLPGSEHVVPSGAGEKTQLPVCASQAPIWHGIAVGHCFGAPTQNPIWQWSLIVQPWLSLQLAPSLIGLAKHPVGPHAPMLHVELKDEQSIGDPFAHIPFRQTPSFVHASRSSQGVPSAAGMTPQLCEASSHTPIVQPPPPGHTVAIPP